MKPIVKQKQSTVQDIINKAQAGGGSGGDSYTKAEADANFETKTDAASTYQAKADMTDYIEEQTGGYFVVNGIRIYVSSTEPTGNIPDGSIGFGW